MNLIKDDIKKLYWRYLATSFGSAIIGCIYSLVDMAVVGQYQGSDGASALAVMAPLWNLIFSLGLFMGVGGGVLLSSIRGQKEGNENESNQFFSVALIGISALSFLAWLLLLFFEEPILVFFGASEERILSLAKTYLIPIKLVFPLFAFNQMLTIFLRNDNDPLLATISTLSGGIFNIFGDVFFVFCLNMGIFGAGLATAIGTVISTFILLIHFSKKKNTLKIVKIDGFFRKLFEILTHGFSTFFVDVAMGLLTILFNRQIMKYLGGDELAIYGTIINISTFAQCCAYSVGQAAQPIISANYGSKRKDRIEKVLRFSLFTCLVFALLWTLLGMLGPNLCIRVFMKPTERILTIAPKIIRLYSISFLLLPFNVFSTYYFQSIMKPAMAFIASFGRGILLSGAFIIFLPLIDQNALWLAMPITELLVALFAFSAMWAFTRKLPKEGA
ncbi:MAG TPA: multidrug transporter MatE [Firmicutes bacterium]|nr:multidrug transporter MatE [Bacillota bacterium]